MNKLYEEANRVLEEYPLKAKSLQVLSGEGSRKALWHVATSQGEYVLKRSHYPLEKILFSIYGQLYILDKGARVPPMIMTRDGLPYVNKDDTIYMMYQWFPEARNPVFTQKEDLKQTLMALALFHRTLEGYIPPVECNKNWSVGKGTHTYEKMINRMIEVNTLGKKDQLGTKNQLFEFLPKTIERSMKIVERLKQTGLDDAIQEVHDRRLLTHEDFGEPNALILGNNGYVIDIDGLAYNLPSRDLARIIIKAIRKQGVSARNIQKMIDWYELENPLYKREKEILFLEMAFPSQFLRILHSDLRDGKMTVRNYSKVIAFEEKKRTLLQQLSY